MNLIANSGLQFFSFKLGIDSNDTYKMYFHEWFDAQEEQLKLEIAHHFADDDVWVKKFEIYNLLGLGLTNGRVGTDVQGKFKPYTWQDIKDDFISNGLKPITPAQFPNGDYNCFQISPSRCKWDVFENRWLPFPMFTADSKGKTDFGPTNWCRFKLVPESTKGTIRNYTLLLAFDTRTKYEDQNCEDQDLSETPVFENDYVRSKVFALCNHEIALIDFCSTKPYNCDWVGEYILKVFHNASSIDSINVKGPKLSYLAQYIFILKYIQQLNVVPSITLYSERSAPFGDVDLVVDMGNSRTCAILFDNHDFTKVEHLGLHSFTNPIVEGKININDTPFDMRLAFHEADFGVETLIGSKQFVYPSLVRLGTEANELIHAATNLNTGAEKITTFSSPKRYLWDNKSQDKEWEFITTIEGVGQTNLVQLKGVTELLNADGSVNIEGGGAIAKNYSRKSLMTFAFLEILAQAKRQINSFDFRHRWGNESTPRRISRIIITCPTAMSRVEQNSLRQCAEDAAVLLEHFIAGIPDKDDAEKVLRERVQIIPAAINSNHITDAPDWSYDEATSSQFVFLYSELAERYRNNFKEYFEFYGKPRTDLDGYDKKALTIGSVDIGAGTTDLMIAAYKYDDSGQCNLTPKPLFWESFYMAGDDLLNNLIRRLIIEGEHAIIPNQLRIVGAKDISGLILDFFGKDNARQSVTHRQIRSEFNLQVSVPIVSYFLELLRINKIESTTLDFKDVFHEKEPTERVKTYFKNHFGFSFSELTLHYNKAVVSKIVESTFDSLVGKISTILSYYNCDIVMLAGRPTSLKPLTNLFLKYYAISPNRLITLEDYRVGTWYPFHNNKGYFNDSKSTVAVGAMIGNYASTRGGLNGFYLDLTELAKEMKPTTDFFAIAEAEPPFISPECNNGTIVVAQLPTRIWTRQLDSIKYPTRPFFVLGFNEVKIREQLIQRKGLDPNDKGAINDATVREIEKMRAASPFKFTIIRENYLEDKEGLSIESVEDKNRNDLPISFFSLQVQSMNEGEKYWLDSGAFFNLSIKKL
jgi:hypothetical protein